MKYIFNLLILILFLTSCKKDWLEKKRDIKLVTPSTLSDMRGLMTAEYEVISSDHVAISGVSDGDLEITDIRYSTISLLEKAAYKWEPDVYAGLTSSAEWDASYAQIMTANIVLEGLEKITTNAGNITEWNTVKGEALHLRARAFYNLSQTFGQPYVESTAAEDLGISLRTQSDINMPIIRSTVKETYDQIISDLKEASLLLPDAPAFKTDPAKPAAYAMLARVYLAIEKYDLALEAADNCLNLYNSLLDYNALTPYDSYNFEQFNAEVIQHTYLDLYSTNFILPFFANYVPDDLYNSYDANDLRKQLFFYTDEFGKHGIKTNYTGEGFYFPFSGTATDEVCLIRAECRARAGDVSGAMEDLNTLLVTRFVSGSFVPITAATQSEAIHIILGERRKELVGRGIRWSDLRRLNQHPEYAVTLTRTVQGVTYTLEPNSPRYTFKIPDYILKQSPMPQNP